MGYLGTFCLQQAACVSPASKMQPVLCCAVGLLLVVLVLSISVAEAGSATA
jgi:hypothetical protein